MVRGSVSGSRQAKIAPKNRNKRKNFFMFEEFCTGLDLSFSSLVLIARIYE
jgi:hypothetical protein